MLRPLTGLLALTFATTAAAVPVEMSYSARVTDAAGAPVQGTHTVDVSLWSGAAATPALWTATFSPVLEGGYFSVILGGAGQPALDTTVLDRPEVWASVNIDNGQVLTPRTRLLSVPYARVAQSVVGGPIVLPTVTDGAACGPENALGAGGGILFLCAGGAWSAASSPDIPIALTGGVHRWSDGGLATSCDGYRHPTVTSHVYAGAVGDGTYEIDIDGAGSLAPLQVQCDMTTDGGGWTTIAHVHDQTYTSPPPGIGDGTAGTWAQWAAQSWASDGDFYLSLDTFGRMTDGTTQVRRVSLDAVAAVQAELRYVGFDYNEGANTSSMASCTNVVGTPCSSSYNWQAQAPGFDGWGRSTSCNGAGTVIFNYHNFSQCASDSGLFAYTGLATARPGLIGTYTAVAAEQILQVR